MSDVVNKWAPSSSKATSHELKGGIKKMARAGYITKGVMYILIGALSFMAAAGIGGKVTGSSGAFASVAAMPLGEIMLYIVAAGLSFYAIWKLIQALIDPENNGTGKKGLGKRAGFLISFVIHIGIAYKAVTIAMHAGSSGGGQKQTMIAKVLQQPFGQFVIGAVGLGIIGYGIYQLYRAKQGTYMERFKTGGMSMKEKKMVRISGKLGLFARGIVFSIIGYFFIQMAMTASSSNATGVDAALGEIAQQPYGKVLLIIVAAGLILYGIYQVLTGKNKHMMF
ncbi:DUF1206 domain-containing protein [Thalassobacillus hwangdonensis]|uniref:DUF1206 domain-containing protein n=1 Tax=Thalassobacillus hwangdonensis TaxID=546108 RepID=A0ABW3L018_9BACI